MGSIWIRKKKNLALDSFWKLYIIFQFVMNCFRPWQLYCRLNIFLDTLGIACRFSMECKIDSKSLKISEQTREKNWDYEATVKELQDPWNEIYRKWVTKGDHHLLIYLHKQQIIGAAYSLLCSNALFDSLPQSSPSEVDELWAAPWPPTNSELDSWTWEKSLGP